MVLSGGTETLSVPPYTKQGLNMTVLCTFNAPIIRIMVSIESSIIPNSRTLHFSQINSIGGMILSECHRFTSNTCINVFASDPTAVGITHRYIQTQVTFFRFSCQRIDVIGVELNFRIFSRAIKSNRRIASISVVRRNITSAPSCCQYENN